MLVPTEETETIGKQIDRMLEIARKIQQGKTGIPQIDEIKEKRKTEAREQIGQYADEMDFSSSPYINNYIGTISNNGGLFQYVSKTYEIEINTPYETSTNRTQEQKEELAIIAKRQRKNFIESIISGIKKSAKEKMGDLYNGNDR